MGFDALAPCMRGATSTDPVLKLLFRLGDEAPHACGHYVAYVEEKRAHESVLIVNAVWTFVEFSSFLLLTIK